MCHSLSQCLSIFKLFVALAVLLVSAVSYFLFHTLYESTLSITPYVFNKHHFVFGQELSFFSSSCLSFGVIYFVFVGGGNYCFVWDNFDYTLKTFRFIRV